MEKEIRVSRLNAGSQEKYPLKCTNRYDEQIKRQVRRVP